MKQKKIKQKLTMLCVYLEKFNQNVIQTCFIAKKNII